MGMSASEGRRTGRFPKSLHQRRPGGEADLSGNGEGGFSLGHFRFALPVVLQLGVYIWVVDDVWLGARCSCSRAEGRQGGAPEPHGGAWLSATLTWQPPSPHS